MLKIISETGRLQQIVGWDPMHDLLAPALHLDGPRMVTPLVAETADGFRLLARHQEMGNLQALGVMPTEATFFEEYVTINPNEFATPVHENLGTALAWLCDGGLVEVGDDMPYGRYVKLRDDVDLRVAATAESDKQVYVMRLSTEHVRRRFAEYREIGKALARRVVERRADLSDLVSLVEDSSDSRFTLLDAMLSAQQVDVVLAAAPVNVRELTGLVPKGDWFVLKARDDDSIYVITRREETIPSADLVGSFESLAKAVVELSSCGRVGIEETWLSVGLTEQMLTAGVDVVPLSAALCKWREYRDREDIAFTMVVAEASRYSVEGALTFAERELGKKKGVTELDVFSHYTQLVRTFSSNLGEPRVQITPFFVNCHAGDRTIFPALPTSHSVTSASKSLKIDAGLKVEVDGIVLATSDLARTLATNDEVGQVYEILRQIVHDQISRTITVDQRCEHVHQQCLQALLDKRSALVDLGMLPTDVDLEARYSKRNVGHLMGKQESFVTEFRPGDEDVLREGAIGALELQWPCNGASVGAEEMWILTSQGSRLLTA